MTLIDLPTSRCAPPTFEEVTFDLYRDIHKAIRVELFSITETAGSVGPNDPAALAALAAHVSDVTDMLDTHAAHEDQSIGVVLPELMPELAERIEADHVVLEERMAAARDLIRANADGGTTTRASVHHGYLLLASFTSAYLAHQELEEMVVMPALEQAIGVPAVIDLHQQIISSIPPAELAQSLPLMLRAMNVDDRADLLGGMKAGAPPEVFDGIWALAGSALPARDLAEVGARLGLG